MKYDTKNTYGKRMVKEAKIAEIGKDPYTAGTGIEIEDGVLSIDTSTVALKTDIPTVTPVEANTGVTPTATLTDLQVGTVTYEVPQGGSGKYLHQIQIAFNSSGTGLFFYTYYVSNSATAYTVVTDFLTDAGYTITDTSDTMSRYLSAAGGSTQYAIAYRQGTSEGIYLTSLTINSSGVIAPANWSNQSNTPGIVDVVVAL